jgi:putative transposase
MVSILHSERFVDQAPQEIYSTLLDEGKYICSIRTIYRILTRNEETKERRNITRHKNYQKPELIATAPNQVWSWDITKLHGPEKWNYFYLYVIIDIFSRYVVGWMIADKENGQYAQALIAEASERQKISENQLTIHSDRGTPMKSKPVAFLMADLGITKSFSRPHVSDDNPFSEAHFKTLKYCPQFPQRFGCQQDAKSFGRRFFAWYNTEHKHSGIGYYTPEDVHYGRASAVRRLRGETLNAAFAAHPERFVNKIPEPTKVPTQVWINPPKKEDERDQKVH